MKFTLLFLLLSTVTFGQNLKSTSIYFDVNQSQSAQLASSNTDAFLDKIPVNSKIIRIEAYCDSTGSNAYNMKLAQKRYHAVHEFMKELPYNMESTELIAFGESTAKGSKLSPDQSRRVDIYFVEPAIKIAPPVEIVEEIEIPPVLEKVPPTSNPVSDGEFSKKAIEKFMGEESSELRLDMNILFANVSDRVLRESEGQLKELLKTMEDHPNLNAEIHGHVCCATNYELSEARARTVYMYLVQNKIDPERLSYVGHSNDQPKAWPELTENDRKQNRRVTVVFTK